VNANQVFYWRKLHREGQLGSMTDVQPVPVNVANDRSVEAVWKDDFIPREYVRRHEEHLPPVPQNVSRICIWSATLPRTVTLSLRASISDLRREV
jgi:hypothetical protein